MNPPPLPPQDTKVQAIEAPTHLVPKCPHCQQEINNFLYRSIHHEFLTRLRKNVYFCPHCHAVLSIAETAI